MKVTMELKLLPDKQTAALLDFTMAECGSATLKNP